MKIYTIFGFTFLAFQSISQISVKPNDIDSEWKSLQNDETIEVFVRQESCKLNGPAKPFDFGFFKVVNNTDRDLNLTFQVAIRYENGSCNGCDANNESVRSVTVPAAGSIESDCTFENGELSFLLRNPLVAASENKINSIEILNLQIQK